MFTLVHVIISLLGIITGLVAVGGFMAGARREGVTAVFLITTILTNATGFGFPSDKLLPSHVVAALSLVLLAVCVVARYVKHLEGAWRRVFVITAVAFLLHTLFSSAAESLAGIGIILLGLPAYFWWRRSEPPRPEIEAR